MTRQSPGQNSNYSARVTNRGATRTVVLNDAANTVASTKAGVTYDVSAYVRSSQPGVSLNLRTMEYAGTTKKGQAEASTWLTDTAWHKLTFAYRAVSTGASLDLNVLAWNLPTNRSFDVDNITLTPRSTITTSAPAGWRMAWADEFNGTTLDTTKWNAENNSTFGDGNKELACLMNRPENIALGNGALTLRARHEATPLKCGSNDSRFPNGRSYSSAMVDTRGKMDFNYGRFEMRAKLPTQAVTSKGLWPAFWMRPTNGGTGELDIMEAVGSNATGNEQNKVHHTIWYDYNRTYPHQTVTHAFASGLPSDGFHTYAAEWDPGVIRWYVDGKLTYERNRTTTTWLDQAFAPGKKFFLRLNLAVGGNWPGSPDAATKFPGDYIIDYVRAYQR